LAMSIQNKARRLRENGLSYAAIGKELRSAKAARLTHARK